MLLAPVAMLRNVDRHVGRRVSAVTTVKASVEVLLKKPSWRNDSPLCRPTSPPTSSVWRTGPVSNL